MDRLGIGVQRDPAAFEHDLAPIGRIHAEQ